MLKSVKSNKFSIDPLYYKDRCIIQTKYNYDELYLDNKDIDELIKLLEEAKCQFK